MRVITKSAEETKELGRRLAKILMRSVPSVKPSCVIALFGDLGSGKTVLVKGIAEGLGAEERDVLSPSFVLIREYKTKIPLYHFDLYRLRKADIYKLGFDEYFYGRGISVIEWADRIKEALPEDCLRIELSVLGKGRRLIKVKGKNNEDIRY